MTDKSVSKHEAKPTKLSFRVPQEFKDVSKLLVGTVRVTAGYTPGDD